MENVSPLELGLWVMYCALIALLLVATWKTFVKAGKPGWGAIIPVYNIVLLCEIAGKPGWWTIFYFIPLVNIVIDVIVSINIAKGFGKGAGFGLGLAFLGPIFYPILAFGSADYTG
jgi:hypothetical protein